MRVALSNSADLWIAPIFACFSVLVVPMCKINFLRDGKKRAYLTSFKTGLLACGLIISPWALATVPTGAVKLSASNVFIASSRGVNFTCGKLSGKWTAGSRVGPGKSYFLSYAKEIQNTKRDIQRAKSSKKKQLQAKLKSLTALSIKGASACKVVIPSPTPTPASNASFDFNGNVTDSGKIRFGIPHNLNANVTEGRSVYNSTCGGCHEERLYYTFPTLRQNISLSPMLYDTNSMTDAMLAQLTAYLNRYSP